MGFLGLRRKLDCLGWWWASTAQLNMDTALQLLKNQKEPGSQFPLMLDLCGYLLMNCCDNLFPHRIGKFSPDLGKQPMSRRDQFVWSAAIQAFLVRQILLSSGVIACASSKLQLNI